MPLNMAYYFSNRVVSASSWLPDNVVCALMKILTKSSGIDIFWGQRRHD